MSNDIRTLYPGRVNPADTNYPFGSIKNESVPGANDGTPLTAEWGNDFEALKQAVLAGAGEVPNGSTDTVTASQMYDALNRVHSLASPTLAHASAQAYAKEGMSVNVAERTTGAGGASVWDYVLLSSVTPNGDNIIACIGNTLLALVLRQYSRVTAQQFGYSAASTDATEVQAAIDYIESLGGGRVTIEKTAGPTLTSRINMKSNVEVYCYDDINFTTAAGAECIDFNGIENAKWFGGVITSDGVSSTQTCFNLRNGATNNVVAPTKVVDFKNKGVDINTASNKNLVYRPEISGSDGSTGSGISVFGAGGDRPDENTIFEPYVHDCRGGVSVQGGWYNKVIRPIIEDVTLWGVGLDGVITASGDGAKYTYVERPVCRRVINASFGGIYCGNGSSFNEIHNPVCHDCTNGVRQSGGTGYEPRGNKYYHPVIDGNTDTLANGAQGMQFSASDSTEIYAPDIKNVTARGIYLFTSPNSKVFGGEVQNCGGEGVYLQTAGCTVQAVYSHDNDYGFRIEFGGDADGTNRFAHCVAENNTTDDFKRGISTTFVQNCIGFINTNSGVVTILSGTNSVVVNHGCDYTPSIEDIVITASNNPTSLGGVWVGNLTSTTFQINSNNNAAADSNFAWRVQEIQL